MRIPSVPGLRLHFSEAHAGGRVRDADEVLAAGTLDLASGELRFALERLVAVGAVEFEFVCVHSLYPHKRISGRESMFLFWHILFVFKLRLLW